MNSQDYRDIVPAYALGALDPDEAAALEDQMLRDPELRAEVQRYRVLVAELSLASAPIAPPAQLKSRLLAQVAQAGQPVEAEAAPVAEPQPAGLVVRRLPLRRWGQLAAALVAALLIGGLGVGWFQSAAQLEQAQAHNAQLASQINEAQRNLAQLRSTQEQLTSEIEQARNNQQQLVSDLSQSRAQVKQLQQQVDSGERLVSFLGSANLALRDLKPTGDAPRAHGSMYMRPGVKTAVLLVAGLPPLPQGQSYQFWLASDRSPIQFNAGLLEATADGSARLLVEAPLPLDQFQRVMVTVEQGAQQVPRPSQDTILFGAL